MTSVKRGRGKTDFTKKFIKVPIVRIVDSIVFDFYMIEKAKEGDKDIVMLNYIFSLFLVFILFFFYIVVVLLFL